MLKHCVCCYLPTNSDVESSMGAVGRSVPDKPANSIVSTPVWLVLHIATRPEAIRPVHLNCGRSLELLLPDFGAQGI